MRKLIAAINMTLDGYCDHDSMIADEEIHRHYSELIRSADTILYGRTTFQLMEFWPSLLKNPSGNKAMDEFAAVIDKIPKVVFSRTLKTVNWETARLAEGDPEAVTRTLRSQAGGDILVGSRSLIIQLLNLGLIDELQLCIQPIIAGKGLTLLENIQERIKLRLQKSKVFSASGSILLYYQPVLPSNDKA